MIWIECAYCGKIYLAKRRSRKYCCDGCRTMANRQRRVDEQIKKDRLAFEYQCYVERARLEKIWKLEDQQEELIRQQQLEKERQKEAEDERLAKEKKMAEEQKKKAAREKEKLRNIELFETFAPIIANGAFYFLGQLLEDKSKENSQSQQHASATPSNETTGAG